MNKLSILFIIKFFIIKFAFSQSILEVGTGIGYSLANHPDFPEVNQPAYYGNIGFLYNTKFSTKGWANAYRYPIVGVELAFQTLGNQEVLGQAIGLAPTLSPMLWRKEQFSIQLKLGLGAAYLTRPFDKIDNPENTVLGAKGSAYVLAFLNGEWHIKKRYALLMGLGITHYSNGSISNPNLGANVPTFYIAHRFLYKKKEFEWKENQQINFNCNYNKKIRPWIRASYGLTEKSLDGPRYPVGVGGVGVHRSLSCINRISIGVEYIYHRGNEQFLKHNEDESAEEEAWRLVAFAGHEFLFGQLGVIGEAGIYLREHFGQRSRFSTKIGLNFYPRNHFKHPKHQPYIGAHIRAYGGEAEFIEMVTGYYF